MRIGCESLNERYEYRVVRALPGRARDVAKGIRSTGAEALGRAGGSLFGLWSGQIGLGSNDLIAVSVWPHEETPSPLLDAVEGVEHASVERVVATVRPTDPSPPTEPGVYAHRWFEIAESDWNEFLSLSEGAWPEFEAIHGARVLGFWRSLDVERPDARVLLLTRYPSLAVWERSRGENAKGEREVEVRKRFVRRHALTRETNVITTRLAQ